MDFLESSLFHHSCDLCSVTKGEVQLGLFLLTDLNWSRTYLFLLSQMFFVIFIDDNDDDDDDDDDDEEEEESFLWNCCPTKVH